MRLIDDEATKEFLSGLTLAGIVVAVAFLIESLVTRFTPIVLSPLVVLVVLGAPGLVLVVVVVGFLVAITINSLFDIPRAVTADAKWVEQSLLAGAQAIRRHPRKPCKQNYA